MKIFLDEDFVPRSLERGKTKFDFQQVYPREETEEIAEYLAGINDYAV